MQLKLLEKKLNTFYHHFDKKELISPDPLEIPHKYNKIADIEIVAFISAIFAFGNVSQILKIILKLEQIWGKSVKNYFLQFEEKSEFGKFANLKYRFFSSQDIFTLFELIHEAIFEFDSLENLFMEKYSSKHNNLKKEISEFSTWFIEKSNEKGKFTNGIKFMFANPGNGSSAKRMNLFLRWMVRKDELDFGIWQGIRKNQLVIPVDVHVARISQEFRLTKLKNISWKMAEEITENLMKFDNFDPIKYDFAISHIGMRKKEYSIESKR
jgi:uncharacterized protein (TIGR02757 family)